MRSDVEDIESVKDTTKIYLLHKSNLVRILLRQNLVRRIYKSLSVGKRGVKYFVFTYHVYKNLSDKDSIRVAKISSLADTLRKWFPCDTQIILVKELTEDRYPHYHGIIRLNKNSTLSLPMVKHYKLWCHEFSLNAHFSWVSEVECLSEFGPTVVPTNRWHVISSLGLEERNASFKLKWMKYGIWRYILYITKYLSYDSLIYTHYYYNRGV